MYTQLIDELNRIGSGEKETPPDREEVIRILQASFAVLFPAYYTYTGNTQEENLAYIVSSLNRQSTLAFRFHGDTGIPAEIPEQYIRSFTDVKRTLMKDLQAIYAGDPAASDPALIILAYPGFRAIMAYRLAHVLQKLQVPYIPRIITEHAHAETGIDIHPGAVIGEYFCIDHGTGIVIGETAVLGDHVKLYQGVTIGARSFTEDAEGNLIKGGKRHPDIGSHVVIYANATILGGDTVIGDRSTIGGNVWITSSVPAGSTVIYHA